MPKTREKQGFIDLSTVNFRLDYGSKQAGPGSHHDLFALPISLARCQLFWFTQLQSAFSSHLCWPWPNLGTAEGMPKSVCIAIVLFSSGSHGPEMSVSDEENMKKLLQTLENSMEKRGNFRCHRNPRAAKSVDDA